MEVHVEIWSAQLALSVIASCRHRASLVAKHLSQLCVQLFDLLAQLLLANRLYELIRASVNTVRHAMKRLKAREAADASRTQATKSCLKTLVASVGFHHSWYLFKLYAFCKRWTQFLELWASYSWVQIFFALAFTSEGKACVF
jgi:hypothetical protein